MPILEKLASNGKEVKTKEWFEFREIPRVVHGDGMLELWVDDFLMIVGLIYELLLNEQCYWSWVSLST